MANISEKMTNNEIGFVILIERVVNSNFSIVLADIPHIGYCTIMKNLYSDEYHFEQVFDNLQEANQNFVSRIQSLKEIQSML